MFEEDSRFEKELREPFGHLVDLFLTPLKTPELIEPYCPGVGMVDLVVFLLLDWGWFLRVASGWLNFNCLFTTFLSHRRPRPFPPRIGPGPGRLAQFGALRAMS